MKALDELKALTDEALNIKTRINEAIISLPDNPKIKRFPENKNAFLIMSSDLDKGSILCPYWYDYKYQYRKIAERLESCVDAHEIFQALEIALHNAIVRTNGQETKLHPDVVSHLKQLI